MSGVMQPDDVQIAKHTFRGLAEHLSLLREALDEQGFHGALQDKMVFAWWNASVAHAMAPDYTKLLEDFMKREGEE